jgi:hypothetical protein
MLAEGLGEQPFPGVQLVDIVNSVSRQIDETVAIPADLGEGQCVRFVPSLLSDITQGTSPSSCLPYPPSA